MITISVCVSDVPKESIILNKNGKKYLNLVLVDKKQPDNYGNDIGVCISQSKAERDAQNPSVWVGNGKNHNKGENQQQGGGTANNTPIAISSNSQDLSDLPF